LIGQLYLDSSKLTEIVKKDKIDKYFDMVLISEDIGYMKPYPEFFQISCDRLGIKPEELVFIDDFDRNLINADKVGFTPILYKNLEDLKIKLGKLLNNKILREKYSKLGYERARMFTWDKIVDKLENEYKKI